MKLTSEKIDSVQQYIKKKVEMFQTSQYEEEVKEEDIELLISSLINGQIKDLGGLIALRGFVYQFYVALNYMIDMLHPSGAWWDAVAYELLDDIALIRKSGIRFVQVKTGREDGQHKLKPGDLYKRDKELNSWLDKLFLNITSYDQKLINSGYSLNIDENFKIEFEIATNYPSQFEHYLEPYFMNSDFNLPDNKKHNKDDLIERLKKPQDIFKRKGNKNVKVGVKHLEDHLAPFKIQWCLQRLHINSLGYFSYLEKLIKCKIEDVLEEIDPILSSAIAEYILQNLLMTVVLRTHDDSPNLNKRELIFTKDELKKSFTIWRKEAETRIYEASKQKVLLSKFNSCVDELKEIVKVNWNGSTQKDIIDRLDWIYIQLSKRLKDEGDIDTYEKFLNRLFEMRNYNVPISLDQTRERQYLINSLKYMSICLSFYTENDLPYQESSLLFKKGINSKEDYKTFATFNAQEQIEFDEAKRRIVQTVKKCPETQKIQEDYYCLIIDAKDNIEEETDPFASLVGISTVNTEKRITEVPSNIHFFNPLEIQKITSSLQKHSELTFQNQQVQKIWNDTVERQKMGDDV